MRDAIFKSQCFGNAKDLVKAVSIELLNSAESWKHVVKATHEYNSISFVIEVYADFNKQLSPWRQANENVKNCESLFETWLTRFKAHCAGSIPDFSLALILLSKVDIEDDQRVSILIASIRDVSPDGTDPSSAGTMSKVNYGQIAPVLRQCVGSCTKTRHNDGPFLNDNYTNGRNGNSRRQHGRGNSPQPEHTATKLATLKAKYPRILCKKK